jgi:transposase
VPLWRAAQPRVYVADASLYNEENLIALGQTPWISRVPVTIAEAQQLMQTLPQSMFSVSSLNNYAIALSVQHLRRSPPALAGSPQ